MDLLYSLLKVTSMIATGVFGALGLLTKYKNDHGKITKWGKVALGGILISSGISLGLYILETSKAKTSAIKAKADAEATAQKLETILVNAQTTAEQQKRSLEETNILKLGLEKTLEKSDYIAKGMENSLEAQQSVLSGNKRILGGVTNTIRKQGELLSLNTGTLNEVSRGLYTIKDVRIDYEIHVPMDHLQLRSYLNRFVRDLSPLLPLKFDNRPSWITGGTGSDSGNIDESFDFSSDAPLAPDRTRERLAYTILATSGVELQFFKNPIAPSDHPLISGNWQGNVGPDLSLYVVGALSNRSHTINYGLKSKRFSLRAGRLSQDPHYWKSTGKILGIPDLLGAQMFVRLESTASSGDPTVDQYLHEIRRGFELDILIVSLSSGRGFWFDGADFEKHQDKDGYPIYSFIFPKTLDELRKLERR
jgi:hypothetical protein